MVKTSGPSDIASIIAAGIGAAAGLGGLSWGLYTYKGEQNSKRKGILFPLIEEFDKSKEMEFAKGILDGKNIKPKWDWKYPWGYYKKSNLSIILRNHKPDGIDDLGEVAIRYSFDALLDFFCKLEYLLKIKLVKPEEVDYFTYYTKIAANEEPIRSYINYYDFPLGGLLSKHLSRSNKDHNGEQARSNNPNPEIKDQRLQYLKEVTKSTIPIQPYLVGNKLGLTPDRTEEIITYLEEKGLIRRRPPSFQEGDSSKLEITDQGNEIISSGKSLPI